MNHWYLLVLLFALGACAGQKEVLVVKQYKLRDLQLDSEGDSMAGGEKKSRLHGAVSMAERSARLGEYFTVLWNDPQGIGTGEVEILFEYQQGASGSQIKRMLRRFDSNDSSGKVEFSIIGSDYLEHGRVLAWKTTLSRGGRELANRKSYLWR